MEKHNELVLKLIISEAMEENDSLFLQEIESVKKDRAFANNDISRKKIAKIIDDWIKKSKLKHRKKTLARVASVLFAVLVGLSAVTLSVDGVREKIWKLITNNANPSYSLLFSSDDRDDILLADYEGLYIPTRIPENYDISAVYNEDECKTILLKDKTNYTVLISEYPENADIKLYVDKENIDSYNEMIINQNDSIITTKDGNITVLIKADKALIQIISNDPNLDAVGFAKHIEEK